MKLKICGLKYKDNIEEVAALQPDYMGFIFYPKSKRFVGDDFEMPAIPNQIKKVGVFVNATFDELKEKVNKYKLDIVQLHGDESPELCGQTRTFVKVMKAFGVDESFDFKTLEPYKEHCDYFLFDTKTNEYGGSGRQFDWNIVKEYQMTVPFFLSGGIGIDEINRVSDLRSQISNLYSVDVNSKFEIEPGLKDIEKLKKLVKITAEAQRR